MPSVRYVRTELPSWIARLTAIARLSRPTSSIERPATRPQLSIHTAAAPAEAPNAPSRSLHLPRVFDCVEH
jgi:hypothetical protein